jgi:hypothetical protein
MTWTGCWNLSRKPLPDVKAIAGSLLLLDHKTRKLISGCHGENKKESKLRVNLDRELGYVRKQIPSLIFDVKKDPRWYKENSESSGYETRSIACCR